MATTAKRVKNALLECQDLEKDIDEVVHQILSVKQEKRSEETGPNHLLKTKLLSLRSELEARERHNPIGHLVKGPFSNPQSLSEELDKMISQNEDLMKLIAAQIEGCERSIEEVSSHRSRQEEIHAALQRHLAERAGGERHDLKKTLEAAKQKHSRNLEAVKLSTERFLDEQFPVPSAKDLHMKGGDKLSVKDLLGMKKYESMRQMLEELVDLMFGGSQDPYLTLGPRHWPQYVEVLLRFGVAVRHPSDEGRIKLTDNYV